MRRPSGLRLYPVFSQYKTPSVSVETIRRGPFTKNEMPIYKNQRKSAPGAAPQQAYYRDPETGGFFPIVQTPAPTAKAKAKPKARQQQREAVKPYGHRLFLSIKNITIAGILAALLGWALFATGCGNAPGPAYPANILHHPSTPNPSVSSPCPWTPSGSCDGQTESEYRAMDEYKRGVISHEEVRRRLGR